VTGADDPAAGSPLRIDFVDPPVGGAIGMTHCPGRRSIDDRGRTWDRDLERDLRAIAAARIDVVVTLLGDEELRRHGAEALADRLASAGIRWLQLPIRDFGVPDPTVANEWRAQLPKLVDGLRTGDRILVHCAAGLGRTGTMAATLLVACGVSADEAVRTVRRARPGTIETERQEGFVRAFEP
jgi:protein-tyrosine phosphatase